MSGASRWLDAVLCCGPGPVSATARIAASAPHAATRTSAVLRMSPSSFPCDGPLGRRLSRHIRRVPRSGSELAQGLADAVGDSLHLERRAGDFLQQLVCIHPLALG